MPETGKYQHAFEELSCCVLIPTYNNAKTLGQVITAVLAYTSRVIVVNDGSTDNTAEIIAKYPAITKVQHQQNQGKGQALRSGFSEAIRQGYRYAITIDSDGQHFAKDLPVFLEKVRACPDSLIIGARNMTAAGIPQRSSFGNRFSNFWYQVETGIKLPDTQSGYRLYPLQQLKGMRFYTAKFEFEIEVIVRLAWKGVHVTSVPVSVSYPEGRVSHFRPFKDFLRISVLNTVLVTLALLWYRWYLLLRNLSRENIRKLCWDPEEPSYKKGLAVGIGVMVGILPIWGLQTAAALLLAFVFRVNKVLTFAASNISIPPFIPFIVYGSLLAGSWLTGTDTTLPVFDRGLDYEIAKAHFLQYLAGSVFLAVLAGLFLGGCTVLLLAVQKRKRGLWKKYS